MATQVLASIANSTNTDDLIKEALVMNNGAVSRIVSLLGVPNGRIRMAAMNCLRCFVDSSSVQLKKAVANSEMVARLTELMMKFYQPQMIGLLMAEDDEYAEVISFLISILRDEDFQQFHHEIAIAIADYIGKSYTFLLCIFLFKLLN